MNPLTETLINLDGNNGSSSIQYLQWMLADIRRVVRLPVEQDVPEAEKLQVGSLVDLYLTLVRKEPPFIDILGETYEQLAQVKYRQELGRSFTPWPVALIAILSSGILSGDQPGLFRVVDPTVGSGRLLLAAAHVASARGKCLRRFSFSGIEQDELCADMAAMQFAVNKVVHGMEIGELCFHRGDARADPGVWKVVLHDVVKDLDPADYYQADHPERIRQLKYAAQALAGHPGSEMLMVAGK